MVLSLKLNFVIILFCSINLFFVYNSTNTNGLLLAAVSAFTNLPPPYRAATSQGRCGVVQIGCTWCRAIGIALLCRLTDAQEGFSFYIHDFKKRTVRGGVYPIERTIGIKAISLSVLDNRSSLVLRLVIATHILLIYLYRTFQLANIGYNSIKPICRIMENPADLPPPHSENDNLTFCYSYSNLDQQ